jgi:hypothetical protein
VIVDEIRMYVDSPGDHVFSLFDEKLFGAHPLGADRRDPTLRCVELATRRWSTTGSAGTPARTSSSAAGAIGHEEVLRGRRGWLKQLAGEAPTWRQLPRLPALCARVACVSLSASPPPQGNLCHRDGGRGRIIPTAGRSTCWVPSGRRDERPPLRRAAQRRSLLYDVSCSAPHTPIAARSAFTLGSTDQGPRRCGNPRTAGARRAGGRRGESGREPTPAGGWSSAWRRPGRWPRGSAPARACCHGS